MEEETKAVSVDAAYSTMAIYKDGTHLINADELKQL
jgi:hypothetical protein